MPHKVNFTGSPAPAGDGERAGTAVAALDGVAVRLGRMLVLRRVDLVLRPGEAVGLTGPNGSGKTTLLRTLATLVAPAAGNAEVLGADLATGARRAVRPRIGLVGHEPALYPQLTLAENLALAARLRGCPTGRADRLLGAAGLEGARDWRAQDCSLGMRRRTELARLLLEIPLLLLLDEAHAGLDADARGLVRWLVDATRTAGGAAVVVAHDPAWLGGLVDRAVQLVDGELRPVEVAP